MLKIICAHPGTGRRDLFHALRNSRASVVNDIFGSSDLNKIDWQKASDSPTQHIFIFPSAPKVLDKLIELDLSFDLVYPNESVSSTDLQHGMACEGLSLSAILGLLDYRHRTLQLLQGITYPKCTHIVLGAGKNLVDTHGSSNHESQSS